MNDELLRQLKSHMPESGMYTNDKEMIPAIKHDFEELARFGYVKLFYADNTIKAISLTQKGKEYDC